MSLALNVDRALAGRCIICDRRLPKHRIALYNAQARTWTRGVGEDMREVEVCVCGDRCLQRYEDGEEAAG
ncbi:MAG: hypothetical protein A2Y61_05365 [Chloroflexi bacterium RBG_13_60_13]|nr:MAG: hypothetical protein A2Y61_05365 [Chloroflexi bacterium RBG_13_60_13]